MGIGMGIIGGAMQGAGYAGMALASKAGDYLEHSQLQKEMADIQALRDQRLSEIRKSEMAYGEQLKRQPAIEAAADVDKFKSTPAYDEGADTARPKSEAEVRDYEKGALKKRGLIGEAMQMDEHDRTRDLSRELAKLTDERIREEGQLNRDQQLTLHRERMAEIKGQAKNAGLSVQQTDQGLAVVNASTKEVTLLKDDEGKPLKGAKQDDSLAIIKSIGELAKAMETTNPKMAEQLGQIALNVMSKKLGQDVGPQPTDDDVKGLRDRASNPQAVSFFESKYGKGSAARYLGAAPAAKPAPASAAAAPAQPGPAREVDPVQAARLKREAEMRTDYDRQQAERNKKDDAYQQEFRDNLTRTNLRSGM